MKKAAKSSVFINRLHKGFVLTCVALTVYGMSGMAMRWYRYFTVLRPERQQRQLLEDQSLLAEGSSDVLRDNAASLKA